MAEFSTANQRNIAVVPAIIVLAGATGDLGFRIAQSLLNRGAVVRALVRPGNTKPEVTSLRDLGAEIVEVDFNSVTALTKACAGAACVVSAVSGLRDVIVNGQKRLLDALWPLLAIGGRFLYATCSILQAENEQQAAGFLARTPNARSIAFARDNDARENWGTVTPSGRQNFPGQNGMDGFFYAILEKIA